MVIYIADACAVDPGYCQQGGTCQINWVNQAASCICPRDRDGQRCEKERGKSSIYKYKEID